MSALWVLAMRAAADTSDATPRCEPTRSPTMSHTVTPQRPDVADHAAPGGDGPYAAAVAQYSAALLPGVLWLLGTYAFDGAVPGPLHGVVGLAVTALCGAAVGVARRG